MTRSERLSVALVSPRFPPATGGIEAVVEAQARRLVAAGHRVDVFTQDAGVGPNTSVAAGAARAAGPAGPSGYRVHRFANWTRSARYPVSPGLMVDLRRRARHYDLVHLHGYHGAAALAGLFLRASVPVVFTPHLHGGGHTPLARLMHVVHRRFGRALMRRADRVVCVSRAEAGVVTALFPDTVGKVDVVHNGLDLRLRPDPAPRPDAPMLLYFGRLEAYKRVDLAVRALHHLPGWRLTVAGEGPAGPDIARLARTEGLADRVELLGRVSDAELAELVGRAWAVVSMSEHEAFGLGVLEAAAWSVPVVASDIPAHAEVSGLAPGAMDLVPAGATPEELAVVLARVGRPLCCRPHPAPWVAALSWDLVAERLVDAYRDVLDGFHGQGTGS